MKNSNKPICCLKTFLICLIVLFKSANISWKCSCVFIITSIVSVKVFTVHLVFKKSCPSLTFISIVLSHTNMRKDKGRVDQFHGNLSTKWTQLNTSPSPVCSDPLLIGACGVKFRAEAVQLLRVCVCVCHCSFTMHWFIYLPVLIYTYIPLWRLFGWRYDNSVFVYDWICAVWFNVQYNTQRKPLQWEI